MTTPVQNSTSSTTSILTMLYDMLLAYRGPSGTSLASLLQPLSGLNAIRLFQTRAPDNTPFPYATMRLSTNRDGSYQGLRTVGTLEILLYGRPWSQQPAVEDAADLVDQAMTFFVRSNDGLSFCYNSTRVTLPVAGAPADSETVTIRLVYTIAIWPRFLTRLTTS